MTDPGLKLPLRIGNYLNPCIYDADGERVVLIFGWPKTEDRTVALHRAELIVAALTADAENRPPIAELVETALSDYARAQSRLYDRWDKSDAAEQNQLLNDLHFCAPCGREALEALKANTAQPTNNPTDCDGSDT